MSYLNMVDYIEKCHDAITKAGVKESYFEFKSTHTNLDKGFDEFKRIFDLIEIQRRMATTKVYEREGIQLFEVRENVHYRSNSYYLMVVVDDLGNTITKKVSSLFAKKMVSGYEVEARIRHWMPIGTPIKSEAGVGKAEPQKGDQISIFDLLEF